MKPRSYERLFLTANLSELFNGRRPDFRANSAVRNLARIGIGAAYERHDENFVRVIATATTPTQLTYLEIRGYNRKNPRRSRQVKPQPIYSDVVKTILARPKNGDGGGIPLTRGEVAMLFLDGYAGDHPTLLDVRSQGYGEDNDWDGLTCDDVLDNTDEEIGEAAFVWTKWEPLELWVIDRRCSECLYSNV